MKIQIVGNSLVATSAIKKADYELLAKHAPETLAIKDEEGNVTFSVASGKKGYANSFGIGFNGFTRDTNENLTLTLDVTGIVDVKTYAADMFGGIASQVETIEKKIAEKAPTVAENRKKFLDSIIVG